MSFVRIFALVFVFGRAGPSSCVKTEPKAKILGGFGWFGSACLNSWPVWMEQRPALAFFLGALDWAEAAAIGRSLRSLFRSLHMKLDENLRNELEIAIDFLNDAYPRSIFN